jgi:hypothetical protein
MRKSVIILLAILISMGSAYADTAQKLETKDVVKYSLKAKKIRKCNVCTFTVGILTFPIGYLAFVIAGTKTAIDLSIFTNECFNIYKEDGGEMKPSSFINWLESQGFNNKDAKMISWQLRFTWRRYE